MNRTEALKELRECGTHLIVVGSWAREVAQGLGLNNPPPTHTMHASPNESKGVTLAGERESVDDVIGAKELVEWICGELQIEYMRFSGRGSQFRECLRKITKHDFARITNAE